MTYRGTSCASYSLLYTASSTTTTETRAGGNHRPRKPSRILPCQSRGIVYWSAPGIGPHSTGVGPCSERVGASRSFQHYRDVRSDFGAPEPESESFLGYPSVEFIIAAPACAIAATHEAVRDSHLLKHYAPLAPTVEAALVQPADEHAKDELESIDPGHFALQQLVRHITAAGCSGLLTPSSAFLASCLAAASHSLSLCHLRWS